jgi:hypothetical protein
MNYQQIFRQALDIIKSKWELPSSGFLAGGAISNVVWNILKDKNAPINDLDIYHLIEIKKTFSNKELRSKQHFVKNEKWVYEDYSGLEIGYQQRGYYTIEKVTVDGIYNNIEYKATTKDRLLVLESFDINCCQLGYDIDTDEFIWTKEFESFLKTGELRLSNLTSPPHSAMRLIKKKYDLDAVLPEFELDIVATVMKDIRFIDSQKFRFKERYAKMYKKYEADLKSRFKLERDHEVETWLKEHLNVEDKIWTLMPKVKPILVNLGAAPGAFLSRDFLFYVRNILNKQEYEKAWFRLHPIIDSRMEFDEYFDLDFDKDKISKLGKLVLHAPNCSKNLSGLSLSKQIEIFEQVLSKLPNDPFVAISILENYDLRIHNINDDMELLLMELAIRKDVVEDPRDKVYHILGIETWKNNNPKPTEPYF